MDPDDDDEFTPNNKSKAKPKHKPSIILSETGRADLHTLPDHHEHLLSTSFEGNISFAGFDPSSSQIDPGMNFESFALDNNIFEAGEQLDLGLDFGADLGDDLARDLGQELGQGLAADMNYDDK